MWTLKPHDSDNNKREREREREMKGPSCLLGIAFAQTSPSTEYLIHVEDKHTPLSFVYALCRTVII